MTTIEVRRSSFVFGDRQPTVLARLRGLDLRPLYGPARPDGGRKLAGVIIADDDEFMQSLEALLEYADEHMPRA